MKEYRTLHPTAVMVTDALRTLKKADISSGFDVTAAA